MTRQPSEGIIGITSNISTRYSHNIININNNRNKYSVNKNNREKKKKRKDPGITGMACPTGWIHKVGAVPVSPLPAEMETNLLRILVTIYE